MISNCGICGKALVLTNEVRYCDKCMKSVYYNYIHGLILNTTVAIDPDISEVLRLIEEIEEENK